MLVVVPTHVPGCACSFRVLCPLSLLAFSLDPTLQWPAVTEAMRSPGDVWRPDQLYQPCLDAAEDQERTAHAAQGKHREARVGLECEPQADGLKVTGIAAGSSAAQSQLMVHDLLTIVNREFLAGMQPEAMLQRLTGPEGSLMELTALRDVDGVITRVCQHVFADVCELVVDLRECGAAPVTAGSSVSKEGMQGSLLHRKPVITRASAPVAKVLTQASAADAPAQTQKSSAPIPENSRSSHGMQQKMDPPPTNKWRVRLVGIFLLSLVMVPVVLYGRGGQASAGEKEKAVGVRHAATPAKPQEAPRSVTPTAEIAGKQHDFPFDVTRPAETIREEKGNAVNKKQDFATVSDETGVRILETENRSFDIISTQQQILEATMAPWHAPTVEMKDPLNHSRASPALDPTPAAENEAATPAEEASDTGNGNGKGNAVDACAGTSNLATNFSREDATHETFDLEKEGGESEYKDASPLTRPSDLSENGSNSSVPDVKIQDEGLSTSPLRLPVAENRSSFPATDVKRKEAPVPKQTEEGRGEAGLTAVGSLLSLVSLENSSGTDLPSGVFSSASNAANLPAKDSVFYLDSLTSLLVAYSPGPFVNQDEANVRNLFSTMDANRNGTIDFDEAEQHEETERDLQLAVEKFEQSISHQELFLKMDTDGSGYLCRDELRRVLKKEGDYQDEQGLLQLFKKMDSNGDDAISFHEADDYERKDATNAYISPYLNTVANLLAKTKGAANASGTNASFAGDGLNVSYYRESLSQLLAAVSSKAFNATSMTGNESASYLESLSSLLAAYSSSRITPNSSAANSHNASYYGESWSRLLVGVFSSVSNASNLTANDSASYLESLSSLLVAYSPGSLMNTSNTPVPKQTEGTGAAWLASVGSLFSIVSSENASGTDAPE